MARGWRTRLTTAALASAALSLLPSTAGANGRFPLASQLVVDPTDAAHLVARTTYGVIETTDAGKTWRWVCEKAAGWTGQFDPAIVVTGPGATLPADAGADAAPDAAVDAGAPRGGTLLIGLPDGVSRSTDRLCSFEKVGAPDLSGLYVIDLARDPSDGQRIVAVSSPRDATAGTQATYAESHDDGKTWSKTGNLLPEDFKPLTVDVAPSRPQRVYASGGGAFPLFGVIVRSDDRGATWESVSFDLKTARAAYISAIDPGNPDRLYVRIDGDQDRLTVSSDRGTTWTDAYTATGDLLGFALSPDGSRVAIGGPNDGLWLASTSDMKFTKVASLVVRCLTWTSAGLYACADEQADGFTIGLATDAKTFRPVYHLLDLAPLDCPAGTATGDVCPALWPATQQALRPDAGTAPADASAPPGDSGVVPPPPGGGGSSCGCRAVGGDDAPLCALALGAAIVAIAGRTRRKRR